MAENAAETDEGLAEARCAAMRWNTPLSEDHAELLLSRLELPTSGSVLDLGCGWGELLIRAVAATGDAAVTGTGVDNYAPDLARAPAGRGRARPRRAVAVRRGIRGRLGPARGPRPVHRRNARMGRNRAGARCARGGGEAGWPPAVRRWLLAAQAVHARRGDLRRRGRAAQRPRQAGTLSRLAGHAPERSRSVRGGRL